jgi:hypothetical protein
MRDLYVILNISLNLKLLKKVVFCRNGIFLCEMAFLFNELKFETTCQVPVSA